MSAARPAAGVNLYPWDAVGDPRCAERVAGLGVDRVTLAAAYHTVRALTPLHPGHKVVTAAHSAVYYRPDPGRWLGKSLQPVEAPWAPQAFTRAAADLRAAGLKVYAWAVLAHNQRLGTLHPEASVTNAHGDRYPWALCVAQESVRAYAATLAAEVAAQPDLDGIELESCGWYGFDHLHAHDKTGGVAFGAEAKQLLSLCFCGTCVAAYKEAGIDAAGLREGVRRRIEADIAADTAADTAGAADADARKSQDPRLDPDVLAAVAAVRTRAAERFQREAVEAVRAERPDLPVLLHAQPDPLAVGANPGVPPAALYGPVGADGPVLPCGLRSPAALAMVSAFAREAGPGRAVVATVAAVAGLGANRADLAAWCADLRAAGATELRFYHAGLASPADLDTIRDALRDGPAPSS